MPHKKVINRKSTDLPRPPSSYLKHRTLTESVRHALSQWLADGELVPGQKLTGKALSEQLDVSQTPVREAMLQLVAERALDLNPNRSVTVPVLDREKFVELRDMRVALESLAVRCAIERYQGKGIPAAAIDAIMKLHEDMASAKSQKDYSSTLRLNRQIHFSAYELSGREDLIAMIRSLWTRTGPYLNFLYENTHPGIDDNHPHTLLIDAFQRSDVQQAIKAIEEDILVGGKAILDCFS